MIKFERHFSITSERSSINDCLIELSREFSISKATLKNAISQGILWLTRGKKTTRIRSLTRALKPNDTLHVYYDENVLNQAPPTPILISNFDDYSIWFKPYGMLCQGSKWSDHFTINRWIETNIHPQRPAIIVHRLDRAASGLIIIAHSKKAAKAFSQLFEQRKLEKTYQIIVHGAFRQSDKEISATFEVDGKPAKSTFIPIKYNKVCDMTEVTVKIETGRKHQIRVHSALLNTPVVGDRLHGLKNINYADNVNLQLCAVQLKFICPLSEQLREITLPTHLRPNIDKLIGLLNKENVEA